MKYDAYIEFINKYPYSKDLSKKNLNVLYHFFAEIKNRIKIIPGSFENAERSFQCTCDDGSVINFYFYHPNSIYGETRDITIIYTGKDKQFSLNLLGESISFASGSSIDLDGYHSIKITKENKVHYNFYDSSAVHFLKVKHGSIPEIDLEHFFGKIGIVADETLDFDCDEFNKLSIVVDVIDSPNLIKSRIGKTK